MSARKRACTALLGLVKLPELSWTPPQLQCRAGVRVSLNKAEPVDEQIVEDRPVSRAADDRLDSWKEIAFYLNRDVRTVRRWEKDQGLPVRRHQHQKGASVFAYKSEIDAWRQSERERLTETPEPDSSALLSDAPQDHRKSWFVFGVIGLFALVTVLGSLYW